MEQTERPKPTSEDEAGAVANLRGNGVMVDGKSIEAVRDTVGIRLWGVIDFLCNRCGYRYDIVSGRKQKKGKGR